jgi:ribonuclease P protein subunit POP4
MKSFDIDAFISQSFKKLEDKEKEKSKGKNKKLKKQKNENISNNPPPQETNITKDDNKMIIENIDKEKINIFNDNKIDMRVYNKINLEETKDAKNIQTKHLIKPLFPNEEVFEKEFTSEKAYIIDKFINRNNKKNKKKQIKLNYTHGIIKNLKKEKMNYENLLTLNKMWQDYITELMNNTNNQENILEKMLKADLHGAILTVINSTNKNNIGISGIVLFESRRTFNILTKKNEIKTILKQGCIFETLLEFNNMKILIYGDNFIFKSAERTKIKFKPKFYFNTDLFPIY